MKYSDFQPEALYRVLRNPQEAGLDMQVSRFVPGETVRYKRRGNVIHESYWVLVFHAIERGEEECFIPLDYAEAEPEWAEYFAKV